MIAGTAEVKLTNGLKETLKAVNMATTIAGKNIETFSFVFPFLSWN